MPGPIPKLTPTIRRLVQRDAQSRVSTGSGGAQLLEVASHVIDGPSHTGQLDHDELENVTADQHHDESHVLADASALGPDHTTSGLTVGWVLRATAAGAAKFMQLLHSDLGSVGIDDHHARDHASRHANGGADDVAVEDLGTSETDATLVLAPDGAGGVEFRAEAGGGGIGEILISDTPSTPLVFADLIQNEAQDDLVYADA
jgi:hypothetical protein